MGHAAERLGIDLHLKQHLQWNSHIEGRFSVGGQRMKRQLWSRPITVETNKPGQRLTIADSETATYYLLRKWPAKTHGSAYKHAKRMLITAHEGHLQELTARTAFLAALEECGVQIFEA